MTPTRRPALRTLAALLDARWAMEAEFLDRMLGIVQRSNFDLGAVVADAGEALDGTRRVTVRDGVATLAIRGPLFRYASWFTEACGATSYETTAADLMTALGDAAVRSIVLDIDSPGGEVNGCENMAQLIAHVRGQKPITAYVSGCGASAAYWLAAACDEVIVSETAIVGSIGTILSAVDTSARDAAEGIRRIEVVSSQSPRKRLDLATDDGLAEAQRMVDALADVFVGHVATYRGVDRDTVLAEFGQGGVFVGAAAVTAGLADAVMTAEQLHAALVDAARPTAFSTTPQVPSSPTTRRATATTQEHSDMATRTTRTAAAARATRPTRPAAAPDPSTRRAKAGAPDVPARARRVAPATASEESDEDALEDEEPDASEQEEPTTPGAAEGDEPEDGDEGDDEPAEEPSEEDEEEEDTEEQPVEGGLTLRRFRAKHPVATRRIAAAAATAERDRVSGILSLNAKGNRALIHQAIAEGWSRGATAEALLDAGTTAGARFLDGQRTAESQRPAITTRPTGAAAPAGSDQAKTNAIVGAYQKVRPQSPTTHRGR